MLAFAPLPVPREWLDQARAVCFGSSPSGLPDNYGWVLLVLGPLSMLGFLLAVWGGELRAGLRLAARRTVGRRAHRLGRGRSPGRRPLGRPRASTARSAAAAAYAPLTAEERLPDAYPRTFDPAPALGLVDQRGATVDLGALAGKTVLVSFAFAHCVTVCPVLIGTLHAAIAGLPPAETAVVVITLDPWRDTPGNLPAIAAGLAPRAHSRRPGALGRDRAGECRARGVGRRRQSRRGHRRDQPPGPDLCPRPPVPASLSAS